MVNSSDTVSAVAAGETLTALVKERADHAAGGNSGGSIPFPPDGSRTDELSVRAYDLQVVCDQCKRQGITILSMTVEKRDPLYTLSLLFPERQQDLIP